MPHWPPRNPPSNKMKEILELLGNPHHNLPPVIHVAGTNGKGSVIAFLGNIFKEHGYKAHIFTSPHLIAFNENFTIANKQISDGMLHELTEEIRVKLADKIAPGFFEYQTALAFLAFSRTAADVCLIECGMGAKYDPTNILENKLVAIITQVSIDHQEHLGDSLESIAEHKSHVISCPTMVAPQSKIVNKILNERAQDMGQEIILYDNQYDFDIKDDMVTYIDILRERFYTYNKPVLAGQHQIVNLISAIGALNLQKLFKFQDDLINKAIKKTSWRGRLENMTHLAGSILPPDSELWFDGAHNDSGAYALCQWIKAMPKDKENIVIYGRSENKNHYTFLKYLYRSNSEICFITVRNEPCSETKHNFQSFLDEQEGRYKIAIYDDLEDIIYNKVLKSEKPVRVVICGSLYLYRDLHQLVDAA